MKTICRIDQIVSSFKNKATIVPFQIKIYRKGGLDEDTDIDRLIELARFSSKILIHIQPTKRDHIDPYSRFFPIL